MALQSPCWWAWCLAMGGEGSQQWETCINVLLMGGGYMEGCGLRVWAEFPLMEFASILFRKVVIDW